MVIERNRKVLAALRVLQAVLMLLAFALVLSGAGGCHVSPTFGVSCANLRNDAALWQNQFPQLGGQVFVALVTIILTVAAIAFVVVALKAVRRSIIWEMHWAIMAGLLCVLCGSLEIWYAVGTNGTLGMGNATIDGYTYVQGWAASVFFLYVAAIVYFVDAVLTKRQPDK